MDKPRAIHSKRSESCPVLARKLAKNDTRSTIHAGARELDLYKHYLAAGMYHGSGTENGLHTCTSAKPCQEHDLKFSIHHKGRVRACSEATQSFFEESNGIVISEIVHSVRLAPPMRHQSQLDVSIISEEKVRHEYTLRDLLVFAMEKKKINAYGQHAVLMFSGFCVVNGVTR